MNVELWISVKEKNQKNLNSKKIRPEVDTYLSEKVGP